ncbi:MAG TPA: transglutaminase-like domain-containing protein [Pirellulales bacterium]|nr:transglutaminase-like domain-containing protein [Pirellulales bacterium]
MDNLNRLTFAIAALAAFAVGAAESDVASLRVGLAEAAIAVAVAWATRCWAGEKGDRNLLPERPEGCFAKKVPVPFFAESRAPNIPPWQLAALAVLAVLPWASELARAWCTGQPRPVEWLLLLGLRNLSLGLGALARWPICLRLAGLASFFVVLFAVSVAEGMAVLFPATVYLFACGAWLLRLNWQGRGAAAVSHPRPSQRLAALGLVSLVGAVGIPLVPAHTLTVLRGFMPSSGGDREYDPAARGGVNDGEDVVSAKDDAQSVGMTDSDLFLDSPDPSLYDALSEAYGEPIRRKQTEAAIAVGEKNVRENDGRAAHNQKAGREFSTVRGRRPAPRAMADLESEAMFYVEGRTPLHLRLAAFDGFDGIVWQATGGSDVPGRLEMTGDTAWMRVLNLDVPYLTGSDRHTIKVARFATDSIPTPPHLGRFRLEKIDRLEFFRWSSGDVLRTVRQGLPSGTLVETERSLLDADSLQSIHFDREPAPVRIAAAIRSLAEEWTRGLNRGWPQIEAIAARLKRDYSLDPDYTAPADCPDTAAHFLFEARRGPDFQFASAAASLLHSLGYESRIATGFYVRPDRFDWRAQNTPVVQDDVHAWAEVRLLGGVWTTIEPTPGYALPAPPWNWKKALRATLAGALESCRRHSLLLVAATVLAVATVRHRLLLADLSSTLAWRWSGRRGWDDRVLATLRLLDGRSGRARLPRPAGQTPRRWYGRLAGMIAPELTDDLERVLCWADCAAYAPGVLRQHIPSPEDVRRACARLASGWTIARLRAVEPAEGVRRPERAAAREINRSIRNHP